MNHTVLYFAKAASLVSARESVGNGYNMDVRKVRFSQRWKEGLDFVLQHK